MRDHESAIVDVHRKKYQRLREENCRLQDEVFRQAPVPDKIHAYLTILGIMIPILSVVYMVLQAIQNHVK